MIKQISAVLISKNAEATIKATLDSLISFAEVVVYDNGSTDATLSILENYPNVRVHQGKFLGFGPSKNHAASLASNDWIFSLDTDEVPDERLLNELSAWDGREPVRVGVVERENYLMGRCVKRGGWGSDWLVRLYNRTEHAFNQQAVHEQVRISSQSQKLRLKGKLAHNAVQNIGQFLQKIDRYSEIRRQTSNKVKYPAAIVLRAFFAFFKSYFLKRGFMSGWRGLVIAWCEANGVFFKYMKIYADRNL